jgi:hypothetical protein
MTRTIQALSISFCLAVVLAFTTFRDARAQQGAIENASPTVVGFPTDWPSGPARDTQPIWAAPGKIRFARWDGGRIETAKAMLSGWVGFNPPIPDYVDSMTNWYTPRTIRLLKDAGVNTITVTFSNGFSNATERSHQEQLKEYIAQCHREGIRVIAYQSIANMFWEDMFEHVPESKDWVRMGADGKPTPYGAGTYSKMGRVTRYMARLAHPGWREYLKKRIDLAIDAGADGVFYDNNFNEYLYETYREMLRHATARKRDFVLGGNFHSNTYVLNRVTNLISTEDGVEPGIYAAANVTGRDAAKRQLLGIGDGYLVTNLGLYRVLAALSHGWKPVTVEDGKREISDRLSRAMPARRHQLALAEAMSCGAAMQLFSEGAFADGLYRARPEAMEIWQAVGRYNRFQAANEALFTNTQPLANIAVVLDESSAGVATMNALAARNVGFQVIYEHDLTADYLRGSRAVVVASREPRPKASAAIESFASSGGKVFRLSEVSSIDALARDLTAAAPPPFTLEAPAGVLAVATTQNSGQRLLIHLLNYAPEAAAGVRIQVRAEVKSAALHSPDESRGAMRVDGARMEVPRVDTYSVVVLQMGRPPQP